MTILVRMGLLLLAIVWFGCGGRVPEGLGADQGARWTVLLH